MPLSRICLSLALLSLVGLAGAARAETGQRLEITTSGDVKVPDAEAILSALLGDAHAAARHGRVEMRLHKLAAGSQLRLDVAGHSLPGDAADKLRAMFPALRDAQITVSAIAFEQSGPLEHGELNTPEQIEAFRRRVQAKLEAEGKHGTATVTVEKTADGKQQVRVELHEEKE